MKTIFVIILFIFLSPFALAQYNNYADIELTIDQTGEIQIQGITNSPSLQEGSHDEFISKNKGYWLLDFKTQDLFSDYIFKINLPSGAQINYLKSSGKPRISDEGDHISLIETGENKSIDIMVQYSVKKNLHTWISLRTILEVSLIIILLAIFFFYKRKKHKKSLNFNDFPTRQALLLKELQKNKGEMSQYLLEKKLGWPKSSLSRNIDSLVKKGVIKKIDKGKVNLIRLT